jgi:oxygen-independent coproporphyrinogen-3 oxidase
LSGLYIHIPFCKQKCNYCDFHFSVSVKNKDALLDALKNELIIRKNELNTPIETLYFGGGTPSFLSYDELASLFEIVFSNYQINYDAEITLEANPDDLNLTFLKDLKKLKINRLSIGVQSFYDADLQFMNRAHSAKQAISSIKNAQDIGITNLTIDLIYGIPGLTKEKWESNLNTFLSLQIPHLSSYALTVEAKTVLAHAIKNKKIKPLDEHLAKQHFDLLKKVMSENDYMHYELSNFAKKGFLSKHNTSYWKGKQYLGIGPSAHSYNLKSRSWNIANNSKYIKALENNTLPRETENLTESMRYNEYIMTGLRTIWGVNLKLVKENYYI